VTEAMHPLSADVLDGIDEYNADGSIDAVVAQFAPDAAFIAPGHSAVAGTHRGRDGIRQFFEQLYRLAGGSLVIEPAEVLSNDDHLVLVLRFTGQRDGLTLNVTVAGFHSDHGPDGWRRATFLPDDTAAFDRFFAP
jgi:hypothetical protein